MPTDNAKLIRAAQEAVAAVGHIVGTSPIAVDIPGGQLMDLNGIMLLIVAPQSICVVKRSVSGLSAKDVAKEVIAAEVAVDTLGASTTRATPAQLSQGDAAILDKAGFTEGDPQAPSAFERSRVEFEMLVQRSLTLEEAGKLLSVSPSRLRQRLSGDERTLYGFKEGRGWRIPRFQFTGKKLVRGIEKVVPHIRSDAHPLSVARWFSTPNQDLVANDDEQAVTPLQWLAAGRPPDAVAHLASEI